MPHREDPQGHMSDAEVMATAIVAVLFCGGNLDASRRFLRAHGYMSRMVSKSRFHRRLQRLKGLRLQKPQTLPTKLLRRICYLPEVPARRLRCAEVHLPDETGRCDSIGSGWTVQPELSFGDDAMMASPV